MRFRSWTGLLLTLLLFSSGCDSHNESQETATVSPEVRQQLESLGYFTRVPVDKENEHKNGVTIHDRTAAWDGLNLFNSRTESHAKLMTMDGQEVHRWASGVKGRAHSQFKELMPPPLPAYMTGWNHVELLEGGDLLVLGSHHMLLCLDWNSRVKWKLDIAAHHDMAVSKSGNIHVLTTGIRTVDVAGQQVAFLDNSVVTLTGKGTITRRFSLFDAMRGFLTERGLNQRLLEVRATQEKALETFTGARGPIGTKQEAGLQFYRRAVMGDVGDDEGVMNPIFSNSVEDLFHSNSIQVLARGHEGLWSEGDLLICVCYLNMMVVVEHHTGRLLWTWGEGVLQRPHHATHLPDGNILVFDNGTDRGYSRILKMDPESRKIVWQYQADPPQAFFSATRGGCQQLPNGNVLIAETNTGRVFEVTPAGDTVWEYFSETLANMDGKKERSAIYRMTRLDPTTVKQLREIQ